MAAARANMEQGEKLFRMELMPTFRMRFRRTEDPYDITSPMFAWEYCQVPLISSEQIDEDRANLDVGITGIHYWLQKILHPPCCKEANAYITLNYEEELLQFYTENTTPQIRENLEFEAQKIERAGKCLLYNFLHHNMNAGCPLCGTILMSNLCMNCARDTILYLEICHKPQYWMGLEENVYMSTPVQASNDGEREVIFCVNLGRVGFAAIERRIMVSRSGVPDRPKILFLPTLYVEMIRDCPHRERVPPLLNITLSRLYPLCYQLRSALHKKRREEEEMGVEEDDRSTECDIVSARLEGNLPSLLVKKLIQQFRLVERHSDILLQR